MKLNGVDEENHKIFGEIERNRAFIKKIKDAENEIDSNAMENQPQKKVKLDTAAAMRMVKPFINAAKMEPEAVEPQHKLKTGEVRKLNKGSILPTRDHLSWKDALDKMGNH